MNNDKKNQQKKACEKQPLPSYQKPVLHCYGDVRDITLGPTPGLGESGNEFTMRNP